MAIGGSLGVPAASRREPAVSRLHRMVEADTGHRLGFAVKVLGDGGLPSHDTRRWRSGPHLRYSLERLVRILDYLERHDIRMYRLADGTGAICKPS